RTSNIEHRTSNEKQIRRVRGRPTTEAPRKRRWTHQLWQDGPKDVKVPSASSTARLERAKLFMPDRGTCVTPSFSETPPSVKPPKTNDLPIVITRTIANRQLVVAMSSAATATGVRHELTLTEARALCPGLVNFE